MIIKKSELNKLEDLLNSLNISKWNRFHKRNPFLIDGLTFFLEILLENGDKIKAVGGNKFPKKYSKVSGKIDFFFSELYKR